MKVFSNHFTGSSDYRLDNEAFTEFGPDYYSSNALTDRAIDYPTQLEYFAGGSVVFYKWISCRNIKTMLKQK